LDDGNTDAVGLGSNENDKDEPFIGDRLQAEEEQ
jgi:hypothetical protein